MNVLNRVLMNRVNNPFHNGRFEADIGALATIHPLTIAPRRFRRLRANAMAELAPNPVVSGELRATCRALSISSSL